MSSRIVDEAIDGMEYPCDREQLIRYAAARGAGDGVLGAFAALSSSQQFDGAPAVRTALQITDTVDPGDGD